MRAPSLSLHNIQKHVDVCYSVSAFIISVF